MGGSASVSVNESNSRILPSSRMPSIFSFSLLAITFGVAVYVSQNNAPLHKVLLQPSSSRAPFAHRPLRTRLEECSDHMASIAREFNLTTDISLTTPSTGGPEFPDSRFWSQQCESVVDWDGHVIKNYFLPGIHTHVHSSVFENLKFLLEATRPPPFKGVLMTADNSMCKTGSHVLIEHSKSPLARTVLLPLSLPQMEYFRHGLKWQKNRTIRSKHCAWYGSMNGYANIQTLLNHNRSSCATSLTDRQCVLVKKLPNMSFGRSLHYGKYDCMLAIDGNSWASSFKTSLEVGQLVVRVGGFANRTRLSSYEWFEPYLKHGEHFIQTTIDGLEETLARIKRMPLEELQRIARNGQRAFVALTTNESFRCYVHEAFRLVRNSSSGLKTPLCVAISLLFNLARSLFRRPP